MGCYSPRNLVAHRKSEPTSSAAPSAPPVEDSSSDEEIPEDSNKGAAQIYWDNVPSDLEDTNDTAFVDAFCSYSIEAFYREIDDQFELKSRWQRITELSHGSDLSFKAARKAAYRTGKRQRFHIRTSPLVLDEEAQPPPENLVEARPGRETPNQAENRRLAWSEMVLEAKDREANKLDLTTRLWVFNIMRAAAKPSKAFATPAMKLSNVVLDFSDSRDMDYDSAIVSCSYRHFATTTNLNSIRINCESSTKSSTQM